MVTDFDLSDQISASVQPQPTRPKPPGIGGTSSFMGQSGGGDAGSAFIVQMARIADEMPPWGINWRTRDRMLRAAVHMETFLGSVVASLVARYSSLRWTLSGPEQLVEMQQEILTRGSDFGNGWNSLWRKVGTDLLTTDNGGFLEVLRDGPEPEDAVVGLAHLDSNRCVRTGIPAEPVVYVDENEREHLLREHQVKILTDNPSPITTMRGMQLCAVSRAIRNAQLVRDITNFRREKLGGRSPSAIHLVAGLSQADLDTVKQRVAAEQDQLGRLTYSDPLLFTAFDTEAGVSTASIDLRGLPDGFNLEQEMTWYVTALALAFGVDYQDIAPLQQGNLGNSQQSLMLDRKSRGKGPALYQSLVRHVMNFEGILPEGVSFDFDEDDPQEDEQQAQIAQVWIDALGAAKSAGIMNAAQAQALLLDKGVIDEEISDLFDPVAEEEAQREQERARLDAVRQDDTRETTGSEQPGDLGMGERALGAKQDARAEELPGAEPEEREDEEDDLGLVMLRRLSARADQVLERMDAAFAR